jgi:predicted  nucleic acid-binding Zn-ribbon protein
MSKDAGTNERVNSDDVEVEHKKDGCPICGSRRRHFHTQRRWRDAVDEASRTLARRIQGW